MSYHFTIIDSQQSSSSATGPFPTVDITSALNGANISGYYSYFNRATLNLGVDTTAASGVTAQSADFGSWGANAGSGTTDFNVKQWQISCSSPTAAYYATTNPGNYFNFYFTSLDGGFTAPLLIYDNNGNPLNVTNYNNTLTSFTVSTSSSTPGQINIFHGANLADRGQLLLLSAIITDGSGNVISIPGFRISGSGNVRTLVGLQALSYGQYITPIVNSGSANVTNNLGTSTIILPISGNLSVPNSTYSTSGLQQPSHGTLGSIINNQIQYTPSPLGYLGSDSFQYTIFNNQIPLYPTNRLQGGIGSMNLTVSCLDESCQILTPSGYHSVSMIKEGDFILTNDGREVPIIKIDTSYLKDNSGSLVYNIKKDSIQPGYPPQDTLLSFGHTISLDPSNPQEGRWMMTKDLPTKYSNVIPVVREEPFRLYHLTLPNFYTDNIVVNGGLIIESMGKGKTIWKDNPDGIRYKDENLRDKWY